MIEKGMQPMAAIGLGSTTNKAGHVGYRGRMMICAKDKRRKAKKRLLQNGKSV